MSAPCCVAGDGTSQRLWICLHLNCMAGYFLEVMGMSASTSMARDGMSLRLWVCLHLNV